MARSILAAFLATTLLVLPAPLAVAADETDAELDYTAMVEDIEIMQRIMNKVLKKRFAESSSSSEEVSLETTREATALLEEAEGAPTYSSASLLYSLAATGSVSPALSALEYVPVFDILGYYVPGTGVMYTLKIPAKAEVVDPEAEKGEAKEDLWGRMEGEVRGRNSRTLWTGKSGKASKRYKLDEDHLDQTIDVLLKTLGEYGSRIDQLGADESIILAARVTVSVPPGVGINTLGGPYSTYLVCPPRGAARHHLVIKVPMSAVRAYGSGTMDLFGLKDRAEVTKYVSEPSRGRTSSSWTTGGTSR